MRIESRLGPAPLLLTRIATFVAVGVVVGLGLAVVPNVELVTAVCFTAGFLLGPSAGFLTGALTEALFAGFHPMGSTLGLVLIAQMLGMGLAGLLGAMASTVAGSAMKGLRFALIVTGLGLITTFVFDLLTNLAFPVMAGFSVSQYVVVLAAGVPFAVVHLLSNGLVFSVIVTPLLPRLQKTLAIS
jgi:energy-coupling factor transport system substrate-specific component